MAGKLRKAEDRLIGKAKDAVSRLIGRLRKTSRLGPCVISAN